MVEGQLVEGQSRCRAIGHTGRKRDRQRNHFFEYPTAPAVQAGETPAFSLSPAGRAEDLHRQPDLGFASAVGLFPGQVNLDVNVLCSAGLRSGPRGNLSP